MNGDEEIDPEPRSAEEIAPLPIGAVGRSAASLAARLQHLPPRAAGPACKSLPVTGGPRAPAPALQRSAAIAEDSGTATGSSGRNEMRPRPAHLFYLSRPQPGGAGDMSAPEAEKNDGGGEEAAASNGAKESGQPHKADARAVADRVYDLMRQEVVLARLRGGRVPRGR